MISKSSKIQAIGAACLAVILAFCLALSFIPVKTVQASVSQTTTVMDGGKPPHHDGTGKGTILLEKVLQREQKVNNNFSIMIEKANRAMIKLEEVIARGQGNNQDVTALVDTLDELNDQIKEAHADHDQVARLLENPVGFDRDGKVIDRDTALETIKDIHHIQQDIRRSLADSLKDALKALREYHQNDPAN